MSKIKFIVGVILSSLIIFYLVFLFFHQKKQDPIADPKYVGAVLPHDVLAKSLVDDFLSRLNYIPEKIYLIGPNHFEVGNSVIITDKNSETNNLLNFDFIKSNNEIIAKEHSITVFQNILLNKYPQVKIIPLIISANTSLSNMDSLVDYFSKNNTDTTLFICSVDFSHYKSLTEANIFDQQTLDFIKQKKYSKIYKLNNDNIDSPKSLIIFLKTLDKINKNKLTILNHSNSAVINNDVTSSSTTGHFELAFD